MLPEEAGFLRAIKDKLSDDLPRLAYADWCDEHGKPNRAELIRVGIDLYRRIHGPGDAVDKDGAVKAEKRKIGNWTAEERALGEREIRLAETVYGPNWYIETMYGWGNRKWLADEDWLDREMPQITVCRGFLTRGKLPVQLFGNWDEYPLFVEPFRAFKLVGPETKRFGLSDMWAWVWSTSSKFDDLHESGTHWIPYPLACHIPEWHRSREPHHAPKVAAAQWYAFSSPSSAHECLRDAWASWVKSRAAIVETHGETYG